MDNKTRNTLLMIASGGLSIAGLILLIVQIFSDTRDTTMLAYALGAIVLSNLFNVIRGQMNKKDKE